MSSPPPSAGPMPLDMKRAEDFQREKNKTVGNGARVGDESPDAHRDSVFFDAEKDKEVWKT